MGRPRRKPKNCLYCNNEFSASKRTRFCTIPCWHKWRRQAVINNINPDMIKLYNSGHKISDICKKYNLPESTLHKQFQLAGIDMDKTYTGKFNKNWQGTGRLNAGQLSKLRIGARKRGDIVEITLEDMWEQFNLQGGRCALTNIELVLPYDIDYNIVPTKFITASLDRIDSNKGYIKENIQWVHKYINIMKSSLTQEDFIILCNMVSRIHNRNTNIKEECLDFRIKNEA